MNFFVFPAIFFDLVIQFRRSRGPQPIGAGTYAPAVPRVPKPALDLTTGDHNNNEKPTFKRAVQPVGEVALPVFAGISTSAGDRRHALPQPAICDPIKTNADKTFTKVINATT